MTPDEMLRLIWNVLGIVGTLTSLAFLIGGFMTFLGWSAGIFVLLKRLGIGRWYRKVLIVGSTSETSLLKKDLVDSGVFRSDNVNCVDGRSLSDVKRADLILLDYWSLDESGASTVLHNKMKNAGLVVYSPMGKARIPDEISKRINNEPFTTLVQMRGRLVNDLLVTLMSTAYDKK